MADSYSDGTGHFVFAGEEPKLSPVAQMIMDEIPKYPSGYGFYFESDAYFSQEDFQEKLICEYPALRQSVGNDTEKLAKELAHWPTFLKKLKEAGVPISEPFLNALAGCDSNALDYLVAVVADQESNLIAISYQEAQHCSKMRPDEFGGFGMYESRCLQIQSSSQDAVNYGYALDGALSGKGDTTPEAVVARQLANVVSCIKDSNVRELVANKLLAGEALAIVEDGIVNHAEDSQASAPEETSGNLGARLFDEILDNVETIAGIGEQYGQQTLVDLMYLLQVLARYKPGDKEYIEQTCDSRIVEFLKALPNGQEYLKFVSDELSNEIRNTAGRTT